MGLFSKVETHPEAKSLATYYDELAELVQAIRDTVQNADNDRAFKQAADIIAKVVALCRNMETTPVLSLRSLFKQRSALMHQIGPEGRIGIEDKASRLLARNYNQMSMDMRDKKYWPDANPMGKWYATNFETTIKPRLQEGIDILEARIVAYDNAA